MQLIDDWRRVLRKAWSVKLILLAAFFDGLSAVWFVFADGVPHFLFAALGLFFSLAAAVARIIQQPSMRDAADP